MDSGDHHDGTGLVSFPGAPDPHNHGHNHHNHTHQPHSGGALVDHHLSQLSYDLLAIGNHELYKYPDAEQVANDVDNGVWDKEGLGRYLAGNVNITMGGKDRGIGGRWGRFRTLM